MSNFVIFPWQVLFSCLSCTISFLFYSFFFLLEDPRNSKVKIYQSPEFGGGKKTIYQERFFFFVGSLLLKRIFLLMVIFLLDVYSFAVALWEIIWFDFL